MHCGERAMTNWTIFICPLNLLLILLTCSQMTVYKTLCLCLLHVIRSHQQWHFGDNLDQPANIPKHFYNGWLAKHNMIVWVKLSHWACVTNFLARMSSTSLSGKLKMKVVTMMMKVMTTMTSISRTETGQQDFCADSLSQVPQIHNWHRITNSQLINNY